VRIGTINTAILLTSSYFMARAVHAVHYAPGSRKSMALNLAATGVLGVAFLVLKGFEYAGDYTQHLTPTSLSFPPPERLFYFLYYVMTGIHALHLTIGLAVIAVVGQRAMKGNYTPTHFAPLELTGLYWHFVDLVWIFLYPLLYLVGRHR
jgi:cytochrome c oxidase subunit 3